VDAEGGHIYWTNMGVPNWTMVNRRSDLDGPIANHHRPKGVTYTPKQFIWIRPTASSIGQIAKACASCDPVLDGSQAEILVQNGPG